MLQTTQSHSLRESGPRKSAAAPRDKGKPNLNDPLRHALRSRHYNPRTEQTFESATLNTLRDTLLPKIISGELRGPDAEKFVEEAGL